MIDELLNTCTWTVFAYAANYICPFTERIPKMVDLQLTAEG